jgi:hypothetical protein
MDERLTVDQLGFGPTGFDSRAGHSSKGVSMNRRKIIIGGTHTVVAAALLNIPIKAEVVDAHKRLGEAISSNHTDLKARHRMIPVGVAKLNGVEDRDAREFPTLVFGWESKPGLTAVTVPFSHAFDRPPDKWSTLFLVVKAYLSDGHVETVGIDVSEAIDPANQLANGFGLVHVMNGQQSIERVDLHMQAFGRGFPCLW